MRQKKQQKKKKRLNLRHSLML